MDYFVQHHDHFWYLIAGLSFVIELSVLGLSGPLLFFAIGSLFTGILATLGIVDNWQAEVLAVGVLTLISALILWKPLKALQNPKTDTDNSSDMIGLHVPVSTEITANQGSIRYSGIDWNARLSSDCPVESIATDTTCEIAAISGNTMLVRPV